MNYLSLRYEYIQRIQMRLRNIITPTKNVGTPKNIQQTISILMDNVASLQSSPEPRVTLNSVVTYLSYVRRNTTCLAVYIFN